jgi:hypothetical protein
MLAFELAQRVENPQLYGISIPEFNLEYPSINESDVGRVCIAKKFRLNFDFLAYLLNNQIVDSVIIDSFGMCLYNFVHLEQYKHLFIPKDNGITINSDEILIKIRSEDIENGWHSQYFPLQFSFYKNLIKKTGLKPVFNGQLKPSPYINALKLHFRNAKFIEESDVMEVFATNFYAANIVLSISSFYFTSVYLSDFNKVVHFPIAGLFDPESYFNTPTSLAKFGNKILIPFNKNKYKFYKINFPKKTDRAALDFMSFYEAESELIEYSDVEIKSLYLKSLSR